MTGTWKDFYQGDLQSLYALWVVPVAFLVYWLLGRPSGRPGVEPRAAAFMNVYAPILTIETMLDPYATGPLLRALRIEEPLSTAVMLLFVLLGDFRVYLPMLYVLAPDRGVVSAIVRAAGWTLVVPALSWAAYGALRAYVAPRALPAQTIWIVYELAFVAVISWFAARVLPARLGLRRFEVHEYLRALARYVTLYYFLWASADLLIVVGRFDFGWAVRIVPNQLYYALWIPFAYGSFFSPRYAPTRMPAHRAR